MLTSGWGTPDSNQSKYWQPAVEGNLFRKRAWREATFTEILNYGVYIRFSGHLITKGAFGDGGYKLAGPSHRELVAVSFTASSPKHIILRQLQQHFKDGERSRAEAVRCSYKTWVQLQAQITVFLQILV